MLRFLREHEVAEAYRTALTVATEGCIAVSFWGKGVAEKLGLTAQSKVRVICNLDHPGCNPEAIEELLDLKIVVKTHPRLHAKIYATPKVVIVGSSNASANGLLAANADVSGWIEGSVFSDDRALVSEVSAFFETLWKDIPREVTSEDVKAALRTRDKPPYRWLDLPFSSSLFEACRKRPEAFKSVYVAFYTENLDTAGQQALAGFQKQGQPTQKITAADIRGAWGYQLAIPDGAWLIDLGRYGARSYRSDGTAEYWFSLKTGSKHEDVRIALPGPIIVGGRRFELTKEEKKLLIRFAEDIGKTAGDESLLLLERAIDLIDKADAERVR